MQPDHDSFKEEVRQRLLRIFNAAKQGLKVADVDKHRCEGFIQAGVFMGLVSNEEMSQLMDDTHRSVFRQSIAERQAELTARSLWQPAGVDYSQYESPTIERRRR
ncbi:hypothetical protein [Motiliproteus sediminis]|uniref:hypothetical protein n=1 Tax=Motiliproteus sediminis TaxID=1468178 RepID=UPI001AEFBADC|nr:hypothetical protein [Motiliproteus sediminis]